MEKPSLTFFCELEAAKLSDFFSGSKVINYLVKLKANLSLGLLDLSTQRAEVVKKLNRAKIPITAWILLPKEEGYWTSLDTIAETSRRYIEFNNWAAKNKLTFAAVGLDIEPKLETVAALGKQPLNQVSSLVKRLFQGRQYTKYEMDACALIQTIRADGYAVETYQIPVILDERSARSNVLAKTLGILSLPADREVLMLYTSFFPWYRDSILWSYAQQSQAVGVGSTGGGVEIEGVSPLKIMRWIDLKRDLLLSAQTVNNIYIFSLEGCVQNRYMDRLIALDWDTQVIPPSRSAMGISLIRRIGQAFLWVFTHPLDLLLGLIIGTIIIKKIKKLFS